jgi:hypothetical protein
MTPEMQDELIRAMEEAAASDCRVVMFAGAGEAFCAGLVLSALKGIPKGDPFGMATAIEGEEERTRGCGRGTSCRSRRLRWCMVRRLPGEPGWRRCATLPLRCQGRSLDIPR